MSVNLGGAQVTALTKLGDAGVNVLIKIEESRALERLFDKGLVRWEESHDGKRWAITARGMTMLKKRLGK